MQPSVVSDNFYGKRLYGPSLFPVLKGCLILSPIYETGIQPLMRSRLRLKTLFLGGIRVGYGRRVLEAWDCELWKSLNYMGYLPMEFHGIVGSDILACFGSIL